MSSLQFCEFMSLCCIMHLSGSVVRILLDYVGHVHICSKLRLILEKQKEWPEICEILSEFIFGSYQATVLLQRCTASPEEMITLY